MIMNITEEATLSLFIDGWGWLIETVEKRSGANLGLLWISEQSCYICRDASISYNGRRWLFVNTLVPYVILDCRPGRHIYSSVPYVPVLATPVDPARAGIPFVATLTHRASGKKVLLKRE